MCVNDRLTIDIFALSSSLFETEFVCWSLTFQLYSLPTSTRFSPIFSVSLTLKPPELQTCDATTNFIIWSQSVWTHSYMLHVCKINALLCTIFVVLQYFRKHFDFLQIILWHLTKLHHFTTFSACSPHTQLSNEDFLVNEVSGEEDYMF